MASIRDRLLRLDWDRLEQSMWDVGYARTPPLLTPAECKARRYSAMEWSSVVGDILSDHIDLQRKLGGAVYFIDCGKYTKIGYTRGPVQDRLDALRVANPYPLRVWAIVKGTLDDERAFHQAMAQHRHRNEWFALPPTTRADLTKSILERNGKVYG